MPEYGTCECFGCYRRLPKPQAYRATIERERGRSGGSIRFSKRSTSYSTGRTYYAKKDVWFCRECYAKHRAGQITQSAIAAVVLIGLIWAGTSFLSRDHSDTRQDMATPSSSSQSQVRSPDYAHPWDMAASSSSQSQVPAANYLRPVEPLKASTPPLKDVAAAQKRLIELGYLAGTADGVWGVKSRASLQAFKAANSLGPDEEWDEVTSAQLFSPRAARAPIPIPPATRH
jgi:hypothetical protein